MSDYENIGIRSESHGEGTHAENVKKKYQIHHEQKRVIRISKCSSFIQNPR